MHGAAVRLLHCHGASLDPLKVLEVCFSTTSITLPNIVMATFIEFAFAE